MSACGDSVVPFFSLSYYFAFSRRFFLHIDRHNASFMAKITIASSNEQINESVKFAKRHTERHNYSWWWWWWWWRYYRIAVKLAHHIFVAIFRLIYSKSCCAVAFAISVVLLCLDSYLVSFPHTTFHHCQLNNLIIWCHPNRCRYVCEFFFVFFLGLSS